MLADRAGLAQAGRAPLAVRKTGFIVLISFLLAACGPLQQNGSSLPEAPPGSTTRAPRTGTSDPYAPPAASRRPSSTAPITPTRTASPTPTETPKPPIARVTIATNCRSGPGSTFSFEGVLRPGATAAVLGRSSLPDYWYITNPDKPGESCWLWDEYAEIEGEVDALPELTPAPSPRPALGFQLYLYGFGDCSGQTRLILIVQNTGTKRLMTANLEVYDSDLRASLHGPAFERHPFAGTSKVCPPDHGNVLDPGGSAYIVIPLSSAPSGDMAHAVVQLCTEDFLGGDCLTQTIYFRLPE